MEDVVTGCDGHVRGAKVKVVKKGRGSVMLYLPIQQLFPLEVNRGTRRVQDLQVNPPVDNPALNIDGDQG